VAQSNRERVGRAVELLTQGLRPFIERELQAVHRDRWVEVANQSFDPAYRRKGANWDASALLKIMWDQWDMVFRKTLGRTERNLVAELRDTRNKWAHEDPFSPDDAYRALDSVQRLLQAISAPEAAEATRQKTELLRSSFEQDARKATRQATLTPAEGRPAAGYKPWREVITPHPDVASGRYQQAEFAADLGQVYRGEGTDEYRDPREFFRRTYITEGIRDLLAQAMERLTGKGGDPVVELQTNFGGGKTHSLLALYHLFSGVQSSELPGVESIVQEAGADRAPAAQRAVLVGTAISPGQPHRKQDGTEVRTLWGELAWQLGGKEGYELVAAADATATNPGEALNELLYLYSPCLILIDEWVAYARQLYGKEHLPAGSLDTHFSFTQALTEAARATPKALLVVSIPVSERLGASPSEEAVVTDIEIGGEGGRVALEGLKRWVGRMESPWRPATAEESFEIVRRRLFQSIESPQSFADRDAVVKAFGDFYRAQNQEFPQGCGEKAYERRLEAAYPVHPELFDRLYTDWSSLEQFQRTRGVLRLLAAVIHSLWERQDASLLIMPGSVPIDDPRVQSELTRYLPDNWRPIIEADVDGPSSLPLQLDRDNPNLGRYSSSRRVARTIYLGSAPTVRTAHRGLEDRNIKLGCVQPGESPAVFGDALRRLTDRATHLYVDGRRYWFSTQPSVTRLAQDRAIQYEDHEVWGEITRRLRAQRDRGDFAAVHVAPSSGGDVPDESEARLVILDPEHTHASKAGDSPAKALAAQILDQRGAGPRRYRNALVFLAPDHARLADLEQAVRSYKAWASIEAEREQLNLDAFQSRQAASKREESDRTVDQRMPETYCWAMIPVQPSPNGPPGWEEIRLTGQEGLATRASKKLRSEEYLITEFGAVRLRKELDDIPLWRGDHVGLRQLWEDFAQYLYLPRLRDSRILIEAVHQGISFINWEQDGFAYAEAWDEGGGRYRGLRAGEQSGVTMTTGSVIVKPDVARRQLEQERPVPTAEPPPREGEVVPTPAPGEGPGAEPEQLRRFHGSVSLDPVRLSRDVAEIADAVVQHLASLPKAEVELSLEIQAKLPEGAPDTVVRTVMENAKTLKFGEFGFERE
jgi:predicted AAA+ superfamily ATPase